MALVDLDFLNSGLWDRGGGKFGMRLTVVR